jgi:O-antigen/teichoic acid export membrane protein
MKMNSASTARTTAKYSALGAVVSLVSHLIVIPVAAWNHNLFLVVVAAMFPMFFMMTLRKAGKLPKVSIPARHWVKSVALLAAMTAVATIIFWNHLWLVALVLVAVIIIARTRFTTR